MKIEKTLDKSLFVHLTNEELTSHELKYDELDYSTEKTKDLIRDILLEAQNEHILTPHQLKFKEIKVLPLQHFGCLFVFYSSSIFTTQIFETGNFDNLFDFAKVVSQLTIPVVESKLYIKAELLRLTISSNDELALTSIANEFLLSLKDSSNEIAYTEEYYACLIEENALKVLSSKSLEL